MAKSNELEKLENMFVHFALHFILLVILTKLIVTNIDIFVEFS